MWSLSHVRAAAPVFSINVDVLVVVIIVVVCASRRSVMAPCRASTPRGHGGQEGPRGRAAAGTGYDVISWWVAGLPLGICAPTCDPRAWLGFPLASSGCCNCGRRPKCMPTLHAPTHASPVAQLWTHWDLNPGPSACEADVMPLHHVPHDAMVPHQVIATASHFKQSMGRFRVSGLAAEPDFFKQRGRHQRQHIKRRGKKWTHIWQRSALRSCC